MMFAWYGWKSDVFSVTQGQKKIDKESQLWCGTWNSTAISPPSTILTSTPPAEKHSQFICKNVPIHSILDVLQNSKSYND